MAAIKIDEKKAVEVIENIASMADAKSLEPIVNMYHLFKESGDDSPLTEHICSELTKLKDNYNTITKKVYEQVMGHMRENETLAKLMNNAEYKKHEMAEDITDAGESSYNMAKLL